MAGRKKIEVTYERDEDGWWVATATNVPGCHTQGRSIAQARSRLREALDVNDVPASAELVETFVHEVGKIKEALRDLERARVALERAQTESSEKTRQIAMRLAKAGYSRRDVGEVLGLSFQRVQQLMAVK